MLRCLVKLPRAPFGRTLTTAAVASLPPQPPQPTMTRADTVIPRKQHAYNQQHLQMVSQAIEQVILEQQQQQLQKTMNATTNEASSFTASAMPPSEEPSHENPDAQEKVQAAWEQLEVRNTTHRIDHPGADFISRM